jgi:hypothetical protein
MPTIIRVLYHLPFLSFPFFFLTLSALSFITSAFLCLILYHTLFSFSLATQLSFSLSLSLFFFIFRGCGYHSFSALHRPLHFRVSIHHFRSPIVIVISHTFSFFFSFFAISLPLTDSLIHTESMTFEMPKKIAFASNVAGG